MEQFKKEVKGVSLVSVVFTSNIDGYTLPVKEIIKIAHENKALVLLDGAQVVPHKEIDVRKLDADFLAFSGHKMLGPTGTGVLYAKQELLENMKPFIIGGHTVYDSTYNDYKLEKIKDIEEKNIKEIIIKSGTMNRVILLGSVTDYRNYIAHEILANRSLYLAIISNIAPEGHYDKEHRILHKAIYELEQLVFLFEWTNENNGW